MITWKVSAAYLDKKINNVLLIICNNVLLIISNKNYLQL